MKQLNQFMNLYMNIIVAACKNRGIGINNSIPWHIRKDMFYFKYLTKNRTNNAVIMDRKTYESIGKPLPKRMNIIVSKKLFNNKECESIENKIIVPNLIDLERIVNFNSFQNIWIIGGGEIYKNMITSPHVKAIYYTNIFYP